MKTACPICGASFSLDTLLAFDDVGEVFRQVFSVDAKLGKSLVMYLGLFRPPKTKNLTWGKAVNLLNELIPMIEVGYISRNKGEYPAPVEAWKWALEQVLNQRSVLNLPLKSHGYLLEVLSKWNGETDIVPVPQATATKQTQNMSQTKKSMAVLDEMKRQIIGGKNG